MKILQLCNKVPFPPKDGGSIAMNNLTQGLTAEGHSLKILAVITPKNFIDIEKLPAEYRLKTNIEAVFIDTEIKISEAFLNLFTTKSYNIERFYSKTFEQKLIHVLKSEQFDVIQLESLYVSMYAAVIRRYSKAKIVLRAHNVEHKIWERSAEAAKNPLKKAYLKLLAKRLKKYELKNLNTFDAIAAITKGDEIYFKKSSNVKAIETFPFGIDFKNYIENNSPQEEPLSLFHIGAMDWQPNVEGINWFLNNVWEKLHAAHPSLKLYLAGKNMSSELKHLNKPNVVIAGEVKSAMEFMQSKGIMIVPLLAGGGMRVKIIEGMSLGKTIISTSIGAEGIDCENNKNCIIADDEAEFIAAVNRCLSDKIFCSEIGKNAKMLAVKQYNNADICRRLTQFYQSLTV